MSNIISLLQKRSLRSPQKNAYLFLGDGQSETSKINYYELDYRARTIASYLQSKNAFGQRFILLYPSGIEFIAAFMGCLYSGAIAVPIKAPREKEFEQSISMIKAIAKDADILGILTIEEFFTDLKEQFSEEIKIEKIFILNTEHLDQDNILQYSLPKITEDDIAYLQYTSGSTSSPKGVVIKHSSLTYSLKHMAKVWNYSKNTVSLTWSPHSHVYGLLCGLLVPLYHGTLSIIIPTEAFIRRPLCWLEAITRYRVTNSGCPNFGFDICVDSINDEDLKKLNLESWKVAVNGGETVQFNTLLRFYEKFKSCGFKLNHFNSAYGMSEVTGAIAVNRYLKDPTIFKLNAAALKNNEAIMTDDSDSCLRYMSNGFLLPGLKAVIVDPETLEPVRAGKIGEIWLRGSSVADSYWQRADETKEIFHAQLSGSSKKYFRTGDLGFLYKNELCLTGRLKNLIVIHGKKYNPLDIELTVKNALRNFKINEACIVFSNNSGGKEETVLLQEIPQEFNSAVLNEIVEVIHQCIMQNFNIAIHKITLVKSKSLPRTNSGKIQPKLCQQYFQENKLIILDRKNASLGSAEDTLIKIVSSVLKLSQNEIHLDVPLSHYHFDSIKIIQITTQLNEKCDLSLTPAALYEYKTLGEFIQDVVTKDNKKITEAPADHSKKTKDIAVIGISGIFPEANNVDTFWNNLVEGRDCIKKIPEERWDVNNSLEKSENWGGFVNDIASFDASFFNMSPREAELTDPQQRLFLQTVWNSIEDAGYTPDDISKVKTGLFVGVFKNDYSEILQKNNINDAYITTSVTQSMLANRVSYLLNLKGPSEVIDTACSSSLVAIHHAINAIHSGDCDVAIAGGVNALLTPTSYLAASKAGMLSKDGKCKTFDESANGYVRGEGVGAILLKPLQKAIADKDHIYGIIKGSAVNHGGHANSLTAPNPNAQADVIISACQRAKIPAEYINYIETHGTGTSLGDPIEINGLKKAFQVLLEDKFKSLNNYCALGALKTHIGHLESAAGMASVIKVLLCMKHETLPANLNFSHLNPYIELNHSPFFLPENTDKWKRVKTKEGREYPLSAGISSFGFGGTNAHLVLQEYTQKSASSLSPSQPFYLLPLSAKTQDALKKRIADLYQWLLKETNEILIENLCCTLSYGRMHFNYRCAVLTNSIADLKLTLNAILQEKTSPNYLTNINDSHALSKSVDFNQTLTQLQNHLRIEKTNDFSEKLYTLAQFYIQGGEIDWTCIYPSHFTRLNLPGYPFAKDRYWIEPISQKNTHAPEEKNFASSGFKSANKWQTTSIENKIKEDVSDLLKININKIDVSHSLSELGFDSIKFKELATKLEKQYHIELLPSVFFTYTTIQSLSKHLTEILSSPQVNENDSLYTSVSHEKSVPYGANNNEPIAIIGIQAYFPYTNNLETFWKYLETGYDFVSEISKERWNWQDYYSDSQNPEKTNSKWGACILDHDKFDASFFNISAREANLMDPQHRLFMEIVWKTIEDAGYNPLALTEKTGLFVGVEFSEYQTLIASQKKIFHGYIATGNSHSILANRVSYFLNLHGPSEAVDTACASSLVALHRAINAIRNGECKIAIAGGVSLMLNPDTFVITSQLGVFSPDGRCKTFDKSANGYVKGEGVAAVLLKPLHQAEKDGDHIYGVIRGSGVNHGGKAQSLTAPNVSAQTELLVNTYNAAGINPETITYIEAHGTGTELGDPIEVEALKAAFNQLTSQSKTAYCGLGSVKTNIGHLEPASGIAGVIKVLLAMQHKTLPGILHFNEINPFVKIENSPFYIVNKTQYWKHLTDKNGNVIPRRAGVSSFGFGGTNAHVIIEESIAKEIVSHQSKPYYLITLSAKQNESLHQKVNDLYEWLLTHHDTVSLENLSYTLNSGRSHFVNRYAIIVDSLSNLISTLEQIREGKNPENCFINVPTPIDSSSPLFVEIYQSTIQALTKELTKNEYKEKLVILADLYAKYYPIDWEMLHVNEAKKRIASLPTYPFIKTRYWFDVESQIETKLPTINFSQVKKISHSSSGINSLLTNYLKNIFAEKVRLSVDLIDINETYEVYGIDSVLGLEITNRLEEDFGTLSKTLLYEKNKISLLATYLSTKKFDEVKKLFSNDDHSSELQTDSIEITESTINAPSLMPKVTSSTSDIAIIGISGTYPLADSLEDFWLNLVNEKNCITEIPSDRWNYKDYPVLVGGEEKFYQYGGFIKDVDKFDPLFFNISPKDAALMDPQERLFMQSAWESLEDAGYTRQRLQLSVNNNVGVYVGVTYNFYPLFIAEEWHKGNRIPLDIQLFSIANRFSYFLDFNGPSLIIDTACSSSLAAIHLACESILRNECKMAIAGGVNLTLHPSKYHMLGSYSFMSDEARCASFAEGGNGYIPSEGVGAVVLKPLNDAIRDNDSIYGVIKGTGMNHGGKTSGYTVPNPNAQAELILSTLSKANIDPRTISYIEAHGTGTALGDPIEIRGLQEAFEHFTQDKQFCAIGSVKSNIGHLESAAGISQLTKVLLQFKYKKLVPSIHSSTLNPFIDFASTPFYVQRKLEEWEVKENNPRRAGISSFGAGGANVHIIVEEYQGKELSCDINAPYLLLLSALNTDRLQEYVNNTFDFLQRKLDEFRNPGALKTWLYNVCYTSQIGRESMTSRLAILADSLEDLLKKLNITRNQLENNTHIWFNPSAKQKSSDSLSEQIETKNYAKLAVSWVDGCKIPWETLYQSNTLNITDFPTYPFAKRRCWVPTTTPTTINTSSNIISSITLPNEIKWLIFSDKELGLLLQDSLDRSNCSYVFEANEYQQYNLQTYYINPESEKDFKTLLSIESLQKLDGIIYLWGYENEDSIKNLFNCLTKEKSIPLYIGIRGNNEYDFQIISNNQPYFIVKLNTTIDLRKDANDIINTIFNSSGSIVTQASPPSVIHKNLDQEEILDLILKICARLLGLEVREIDPEIPFQNYGMDSIIGINFISELNTHYTDLLSPMDIYRYPTINQLANYIATSTQSESHEELKSKQTTVEWNEEAALAEIKDLSDDEIGKLIEKELLDLEEIL